jgi:hypothetical protein
MAGRSKYMKIQLYCIAHPVGHPDSSEHPSHLLLFWTISTTREDAAQTFAEVAAKAEGITISWQKFWAMLEARGFKVVPCMLKVANTELNDRDGNIQKEHNSHVHPFRALMGRIPDTEV